MYLVARLRRPFVVVCFLYASWEGKKKERMKSVYNGQQKILLLSVSCSYIIHIHVLAVRRRRTRLPDELLSTALRYNFSISFLFKKKNNIFFHIFQCVYYYYYYYYYATRRFIKRCRGHRNIIIGFVTTRPGRSRRSERQTIILMTILLAVHKTRYYYINY